MKHLMVKIKGLRVELIGRMAEIKGPGRNQGPLGSKFRVSESTTDLEEGPEKVVNISCHNSRSRVDELVDAVYWFGADARNAVVTVAEKCLN